MDDIARSRVRLTAAEAAHLRAWVAALRSGQYRQYRTAMYSPVDDAYCCLGVERLLAGCTVHETYWSWSPGDGSRCDETQIPGPASPSAVAPWALSVRQLHLLPNHLPWPSGAAVHMLDGCWDCVYTYIWLNDTAQLTFDQIADVTEFILEYAEVVDAV